MRKAGNDRDYKFVLWNKATGKPEPGTADIDLPSATTIIHETLAAPFLMDWYAKLTRDSISGVVAVLDADASVDTRDLIDMLTDPDMLVEYLVENRLRPEDVRDEASDRGTEAHDTLEMLAGSQAAGRDDVGLADKLVRSKTASPYVKGVAGWWAVTRPTIRESESVVYNLQHGYAGSLDLLWEDEAGNVVLTDLKTRARRYGVRKSDTLQLTAYAMTGDRWPTRASVLLADETEGWREKNVELAPAAWLSVLETWKRMQEVQGS